MGKIIRQSFWNWIVTNIGLVIGYVNMLIIRPVYLSLNQQGVFSLVTTNGAMLAAISSLGMPSSYLKFFPEFDHKGRNRLFTFLVTISTAMTVLMAIAAIFFYESLVNIYIKKSPEYIPFFFVTFIILTANTYFTLLLHYSQVLYKVIFPTFLREVFLKASSLLLILLYAFDITTFVQTTNGLAISFILVVLFLFFQLYHRERLRLDFSFKHLSREFKTRLLHYAFFSFLITLSYALVANITQNQVATILGSNFNGIFTICFFMGQIVDLPRLNLMKVVSTSVSEAMNRQDFNLVKKLYQKTSLSMGTIGGFLAIGIATNTSDLFDIIPNGNLYEVGISTIMVICFTRFIVMFIGIPSEVIAYSSIYKYNLYFQWVSTVALIASNQFLIPIYGLLGAGVSFLICWLFLSLGRAIFVMVRFNIRPFVTSHIKLLLATGLSFLVATLYDTSLDPFLDIFIRSALTTCLFVPLVYYLKISMDINQLIDANFARLRKLFS